MTTWSSRRISLADDVDVLRDVDGVPAARPWPRRPATQPPRGCRQLLLQQLEMNGHRVERVLHLVRDAGHQPAERGQLARVVQRRVHLAQVAEVARDEHRAEETAAARPRSRGVIEQALRRCPSPRRAADSAGHRHRPLRLAPGQRAGRSDVLHRPGGCAGEARLSSALHRRVAEDQLAARREQRHRVLEIVHHRLEVGGRRPAAAWSRTGADSCALTASNELPRSRNSSLRQIERDVELAAAEPGQAALDDVNRPQHPLREQHRDERRNDERDEDAPPAVHSAFSIRLSRRAPC